MASFDERYALNDEDRKVIASQIKDLDEESFVEFDKTISVLLSSKTHSAVEASQAEAKEEEEEQEEEQAEEATASAVSEVVEQAVDNAKSETVNIPASAPAEEPTIFEKYGNAFAMDQFDFKP